jgi:hypothetical protein
MRTIMERLAREPAAVGTVVASVLPALAALGVISLDEQGIGLLVVAINAVVGFAVRLLVEPASAQPASSQTQQDLATG